MAFDGNQLARGRGMTPKVEVKLFTMEQTIAHDVAVVLLSEPRCQNNMGILECG
jgi:hypothetical protein